MKKNKSYHTFVSTSDYFIRWIKHFQLHVFKVPLYETNLRGSVAVIFGSEEDGITSDLLNLADIKSAIPMIGEIASLNVGVAVGMVLYEKTRQELRG